MNNEFASKPSGTPSDQLPAVLATGITDVRRIFVSMTAREENGRDADYLAWHSLDLRVEQYRIAGLRHSLRLISTPACRAARAYSDASYGAIDHVMTYFFTEDAALDKFIALSRALSGERRPYRLPTVDAGCFSVAGKIASAQALVGADVIPWRPALGVYLLFEQGTTSPEPLAQIDGVAGIWWHTGGAPALAGFHDNTGMQLTYCFLDRDPVDTAARFHEPLRERWASQDILPLFAAPFYVPVPFEWNRYLP